MRRLLAIALVASVACYSPGEGAPERTTHLLYLPSASPTPTPLRSASPSRVDKGTFQSRLLDRTMPYTVYLPPGYDSEPQRRYPVLYLLHGASGSNGEWLDIGLIAAADRAFGSEAVTPFLVVLPQGDGGYWVDHVGGGPRWGTYTATEVVREIDARYRTLAKPTSRAVGGLSMGGHAALQLSLNHSEVFGVVGAHSPSLRYEDQALSFFGKGADFRARDPLSLVRAKPDIARRIAISIDIGLQDSWLPAATELHAVMDALGIAHVWRTPPGDHVDAYWSAQLPEYLRFYGGSLAVR